MNAAFWPGELAHVRVSDGPVTVPCTSLMQLVRHPSYFSFPSMLNSVVLSCHPGSSCPLGHKRRGKVEQEAGVENKESAQEEEERDAVVECWTRQKVELAVIFPSSVLPFSRQSSLLLLQLLILSASFVPQAVV